MPLQNFLHATAGLRIGRRSSLILALVLALAACTGQPVRRPAGASPQRTIIMVWDGLRPDSVNAVDTPHLQALRERGVWFSDNHSSYPTFTMMNAAAFATGSFPATSGFYGNEFWVPPAAGTGAIPQGSSASGKPANYVEPVFTEDHAVLSTLDAHYGHELLLVKSLFKTAQAAGLSTAAIGKSGAAFIQDLGRHSWFLDENTVWPPELASQMQAAGLPLPARTPLAFPGVPSVLHEHNGNPTARPEALKFAMPNGLLTPDSTDATQGAEADASNRYMMSVYTQLILPRKRPDLSVIWFRTPDTTEHAYGPGSPNYHLALRSQDARLGELLQALEDAGLEKTTNLIVVSDHAHSNVSGPVSLFPLRSIVPATRIEGGITNAAFGGIDPVHGQSVSGDVRSADLLTYAGFKAYDGYGCLTSALLGMKADGSDVHPVRVDETGALCGQPGTRYQAVSASLPQPVASFEVPPQLPPGAIVVATNGGSDYFYVPDHDPAVVARLVRFLQGREEYGAVFVDSRHGELPGTLPMPLVRLENTVRRNHGQPDVVAGFSWDATQRINGLPGTEFSSISECRGMHGSFSPFDVHNTLVAFGPAFRSGVVVDTPTGNVDVAPTVARLLGLSMPQADGRVLAEALAGGGSQPRAVIRTLVPVQPATGLRFALPTDPTGATIDHALGEGTYTIELQVKDLTVDGRTYRYFDQAGAVRR